jgi:peroxiredoxin
LGAEVYGISVDSHHAQRVWAERLELTYPLLSDLDRRVMTAYEIKMDEFGAYHDISRRALFIIDKDQRLAYQEIITERGVIPDVDKALEALRTLQNGS